MPEIRPEVVAANLILAIAGKTRDPLFEAVLGGAVIAVRSLMEERVEEAEPALDTQGMGEVPVGPGTVPSRDPQATEGVEQAGGAA